MPKKIMLVFVIDTLAWGVAILCVWGLFGEGIEAFAPWLANPDIAYPVLAVCVVACAICGKQLLTYFKQRAQVGQQHQDT